MTEPSEGKPKSIKKLSSIVKDVEKKDEIDKRAEKTLQDQAIADSELARQLREKYSERVFWYLVAYSSAAIVILVFQGFGIWSFKLDTAVMALLVGSTAVSAIGLVAVVVRGLFK